MELMKLEMRSRRAITVRSTMSRWAWTEEMHSSFLNWMEDSFVLSLLGLGAPEHESCACASPPPFPDCFPGSHSVSHHPFPVLRSANRGVGNRGRKRPVCDDEPQDQVVPQLRNEGIEANGLDGRRKRRRLS
ncbi:hypothetical protein DsansV1_C31g0218521 [Dioscorea sansibarensis]